MRSTSLREVLAGQKVFWVQFGDGNHSRSFQIERQLAKHSEKLTTITPLGKSHYQLSTVVFSKRRLRKVLEITRLFGSLIADWVLLNYRVLSAPKSNIFFLSHPSQLAFLLCFPAIYFRKRIVADFYTGLHDTLVLDRAMFRENSLTASFLLALDKLLLNHTDVVLFDSFSNQRHFTSLASTKTEIESAVLYPTPPEFFLKTSKSQREKRDVIFYGKFSPLQGVEHVLEVMSAESCRHLEFTLIGSGQTFTQGQLSNLPENVHYLPWLDYKELAGVVTEHRLALGVFGASRKAKAVFPNKVVECLSLGVPVITGKGDISTFFDAIGCVFVENNSSAAIEHALLDTLGDRKGLDRLRREAGTFRERLLSGLQVDELGKNSLPD